MQLDDILWKEHEITIKWDKYLFSEINVWSLKKLQAISKFDSSMWIDDLHEFTNLFTDFVVWLMIKWDKEKIKNIILSIPISNLWEFINYFLGALEQKKGSDD